MVDASCSRGALRQHQFPDPDDGGKNDVGGMTIFSSPASPTATEIMDVAMDHIASEAGDKRSQPCQ